MSWTDERVARLSRLWLEGRTASQIANELGEGVSRNAVIGKVHRLGLGGRTVKSAGDASSLAEGGAHAGSKAPTQHVPAPPAPQPAPIAQALGAILPLADRVTILDLRESMCRWPLGDPTSAEFRFCGCRAIQGSPYCTAHTRVAFQPVADRRRVERFARLA